MINRRTLFGLALTTGATAVLTGCLGTQQAVPTPQRATPPPAAASPAAIPTPPPVAASGSGSPASVLPTPNVPPELRGSPVASPAKQWSSPPPMRIDPNKQYLVTMNTTEGSLKLELFPKEAPNTVNNFVFLAREGFYDGTKFHRIIKGFMIQGGDPTGTGGGSPGYRFADELPRERNYERGIIAMANAGPNTQGSQFFIMHANYPLPKNYTIFGRVTEGLDTLDKIAETPVGPMPRTNEMSNPQRDVRIASIAVEER